MIDVTDGVPFLPAVHYRTGRDGRQIDMIVLHWMSTDLAGADATFTGGGRVASAHYGIEGTAIHQYVKEADASYNAANWDANMRSLSIEHSAAPGRDATPTTVETSIQVCVEMMRKYPAIGDRVYPHFKFVATQCPGTLPWEHIRDEALRRVRTPAPVATPASSPAPLLPTEGTNMARIVLVQQKGHPEIYVTDLVTRRHLSPAGYKIAVFWMSKWNYPADEITVQQADSLDDWGIDVTPGVA